MKSAKLYAGLATMIVVLVVAIGDARAQTGGEAGLPVNKPAEQVYANIKALTGVPYGEVVAGMQVMSEALGVDCEHCHTRSGDRDAEGNPNKDVARQMIRMVRQLNQEHFGGHNVISCFTCHRGSTVPVANVNLPGALESQSAPAEQGANAALPSVQQLLDKYVAALGGTEALARITSRVEQGTLTILSDQNKTVPITAYSLAPDKRLTRGFSISHLGNSAQAMGVVNGGRGWMRESAGPVRLMFGWRRDAAQLEDLLNLPRRLQTLLRDARVVRRERFGQLAATVLAGRTEFLPLVELYFDDATGLLTRLVYYVDSVAGRMPSRLDYSDYRVVEGVRVPFHWDVALVRGVRVAYQLESVKNNVAVDAAQFAFPEPPPALYR